MLSLVLSKYKPLQRYDRTQLRRFIPQEEGPDTFVPQWRDLIGSRPIIANVTTYQAVHCLESPTTEF